MLNNSNLHILPECYIDERLCQLLLQIAKVNHKKGFGGVVREFRNKKDNNHRYEGKFWDKPALGVIDRDNIKGKSDFFRDGKNFKALKVLSNLSLNQHKKNPDHYVIIVEPDMERFLMAVAKEAGITEEEFDFLADLDTFTSESKAKDIYTNTDFKRFITLTTEESETIKTLQNWLTQFYNNLTIIP